MKPILFNIDMVKTILDGRKSVTRRVVKPPALGKMVFADNGECVGSFDYEVGGDVYPIVDDAPYQPGDILYVRETWARQWGLYWHKAGLVVDENGRDTYGTLVPTKWRPSIHMPKDAARLFLRVTDVRVERLQDVDGRGILAEGVDNGMSNPTMGKRWDNMQRMAFSNVWDSIIKKADLPIYGWKANPWVWVIGFERISKKEALISE